MKRCHLWSSAFRLRHTEVCTPNPYKYCKLYKRNYNYYIRCFDEKKSTYQILLPVMFRSQPGNLFEPPAEMVWVKIPEVCSYFGNGFFRIT